MVGCAEYVVPRRRRKFLQGSGALLGGGFTPLNHSLGVREASRGLAQWGLAKAKQCGSMALNLGCCEGSSSRFG